MSKIGLMMTLCFWCLICKVSEASLSPYYALKAEGWYWYEDLKDPHKIKRNGAPEEKHAGPIPSLEPSSTLTPSEVVFNFKAKMEEALHKALVYRDYDSVRRWMQMSKYMMDSSEAFANKRLEVVYTDPSLDESIRTPLLQLAAEQKKIEERTQNEKKLKALSQKYGLMFFFSGNCPACHSMAPFVKAFQESYGWEVLPISVNGGGLDEFPDFTHDLSQAQKLGLEHVPSLILVEPRSKQMIRLSGGVLNKAMIEERILHLLKTGRLSL